MNFRLLSVSAVAAIGLTCARTALAGTSVQVSYVAPAVVYAPPVPRPVYYAPPPYYYAPVRAVVVTPPPAPVVVTVPPPPAPVYVAAPAVRITYAQPVLAAPVVVWR
ncbi:hypothetical protein AWB79_04062 [Caballeronia hypogeia]|uniref:Uncharacterized protein n=1 Tax=Caballeronia hypogeia TaxID=1777140 RepID=A0A158BQ49_9BURK|nr:hypothetical protein [Caballeronia hypogeia]SAK72204.1 hypothetical protein AWB79_04062 [Caballeronia hypogeia]